MKISAPESKKDFSVSI